jgi:NTP pyrophosphatase (non-canonical NTP hydrolase)
MGELQTAICHFGRYKTKVENVAEEIADVLLMLNQMMVLFNVESIVESKYKEKLENFISMVKERWSLDRQKKLHNKDTFYDFDIK